MIAIHRRPRQGGKSALALAWLAGDPENRVLAVMNYQEADRLLRLARDLYPETAITERNFLTAHAARSGHGVGSRRQVVVDNADTILRDLFGDVVAVTWTGHSNETAAQWRAAHGLGPFGRPL